MKKGILLGIFGLLTSVVSFAGRGHDGDVDGTIQCAEVNKEAIKAFALTGPFREYREEFERSSSPPEWDIQLDPETVPVEWKRRYSEGSFPPIWRSSWAHFHRSLRDHIKTRREAALALAP